VLLFRHLARESPAQLQYRAHEAASAGNWGAALRYWRQMNSTEAATSATHLGEARACLALGRALQAESSLRRAIKSGPSDPDPWRLLLEILRVEDRTVEALDLGWKASTSVRPDARPTMLLELTESLLADLPDELVRATLGRWVEADPADVDARVALLQRIGTQPRAADPDRASLLAQLEGLLAAHPGHIGARDALVTALADAGEPVRGRPLLEGWPEAARDARYWRLEGRWELEYDHNPEGAVTALRNALAEMPQDWRSWYRLARALRILGRNQESLEAADAAARIREVLDPLALGPRLSGARDHLDQPHVLRDLGELCDHTGLKRLGEAWRDQARIAAETAAANPP
jgi:tetratricopeptide (TPR) repeat protein